MKPIRVLDKQLSGVSGGILCLLSARYFVEQTKRAPSWSLVGKKEGHLLTIATYLLKFSLFHSEHFPPWPSLAEAFRVCITHPQCRRARFFAQSCLRRRSGRYSLLLQRQRKNLGATFLSPVQSARKRRPRSQTQLFPGWKTELIYYLSCSALERCHAQGVQPKPTSVYTIKVAIADAKNILPGY